MPAPPSELRTAGLNGAAATNGKVLHPNILTRLRAAEADGSLPTPRRARRAFLARTFGIRKPFVADLYLDALSQSGHLPNRGGETEVDA